METLLDDHDCPWRTKAEELSRRIEQLERMIFGKRSEKMPSLNKELIKPALDADAVKETRALRRSERSKLPETRHDHLVNVAARQCPKCGSNELKKVGDGKTSTLIEYVPPYLERQVHVQETLACSCGDYIVTAEGAIKPVENGHYGPALMAHVVTAKCVDSLPLYRMEKQFKGAGLSISRSSLCHLFHQTADALKPIYQHMMNIMPSYSLVMADETPLPVQAESKTHRGFMWSFINDDYILYRYSRTRSGETPKEGLYSLVATCQLHDVNPQHYLADVLIRVHIQSQQKIEELLPHRWKERFNQ